MSHWERTSTTLVVVSLWLRSPLVARASGAAVLVSCPPGNGRAPGGGWLLDECAWLQSQAFFLLGQSTTEIALHRFQYLALLVVEQFARGFAFWRERRRWFFR